MKNTLFFISFLFLCLFLQCKNEPAALVESYPPPSKQPKLFTLLEAKQTGVTFNNIIPEDKSFNIIQYLYYYNGGGVATGDINNDGLVDLYFSSNLEGNKLYLNKGNFKFEDITEKAGVKATGDWKTGVTMADVNGDGFLDIYVCCVSKYKGLKGKNQLFINNGSGGFTEKATEYGLATESFSTQSAFFDYDKDGDLDMYLLCHSVHSVESFKDTTQRVVQDSMASDHLFRNDGGRFTDVTKKAGIFGSSLGYGLGIAIGDVNNDGWDDIYVGNDFHENDYLYYNKGNGTFREGGKTSFGHNGMFSMGNDLADYNNDGWLDLITLDMKPEEEEIYKASLGADQYDIYQDKLIRQGFQPQFSRNMLQLNRGTLNTPNEAAKFSEVAQLAGISATDWSWSALTTDLDNDGFKDIFITNGILRRPNDLDYLKFISDAEQNRSSNDYQLTQKMPDGRASNYAYRNRGDLTFENVAASWGLDFKGYANGAAYTDLDNDGDLDLVINNVNANAHIYQNANEVTLKNNFLKIKLEGEGKNTQGIGAKVTLWAGGKMQYQTLQPTRGWLSSVDYTLNFGIEKASTVDSIFVQWGSTKVQIFAQIQANQTLKIKEKEAIFIKKQAEEPVNNFLFTPTGTTFAHVENRYLDNARERLLPYLLSTQGPKLAVGDVNGDGLDDCYIGGARDQTGRLFFQSRNGSFSYLPSTAFQQDNAAEDVGATFFDADGDKDLDLYVASGGNEFWEDMAQLQDRLYINVDGRGNFARKKEALPTFKESGSCVKPCDFDGDGDMDLFVGRRVVAKNYGLSTHSYLLENDGKGNFKEVQESNAPSLANIGMVSDAIWIDTDGDKKQDLVVVGDWMPITIFKNKGNRTFEKQALANTEGFFNTVAAADFDRDGDLDLMAGNLGQNTCFHPTPTTPISLYIKDFDKNQTPEPVMSYYCRGKCYPYNSKDELVSQMPSLRKRYLEYKDFANSVFDQVFPSKETADAIHKEAREVNSLYVENQGNNHFLIKKLPLLAQISPVYSIVTYDFDGDGNLDALLGGNLYEMQPSIGRQDASYGTLLQGDGKGNFTAIEPRQAGLFLTGAIRDIQLIQRNGKPGFLVARNNNSLQFFQPFGDMVL